jgi:hypothetical protein
MGATTTFTGSAVFRVWLLLAGRSGDFDRVTSTLSFTSGFPSVGDACRWTAACRASGDLTTSEEVVGTCEALETGAAAQFHNKVSCVHLFKVTGTPNMIIATAPLPSIRASIQ